MRLAVRVAHSHPHVLAYLAIFGGIIMVWRLVATVVAVIGS